MIKWLGIFLMVCSLVGCSNIEDEFNGDATFKPLQALDSFKLTDFTFSLDHQLSKGKNTIYSAAVPFVWEELENTIGPIKGLKDHRLQLLNQSTKHSGTLPATEYTTSIKKEGNLLCASAYFRKSLPFVLPLENIEKAFLFDEEKVESFGTRGAHDAVKILYYNSDDDFALSFKPKNKTDEIILIKPSQLQGTMAENVKLFVEKRKVFGMSRTRKDIWRFRLKRKDKVQVPKLNFHLDHTFTDFSKQPFLAQGIPYVFKSLYLRNAFVLNEKGAEVESEGIGIVDGAVDRNPSKKLLFDKPFLVLLKKKDQTYPYFACTVVNPELMIPFTK